MATLVAACHSPEPSSFDLFDARAERFLEVRVFPGRDGSTLHLRDVTALGTLNTSATGSRRGSARWFRNRPI